MDKDKFNNTPELLVNQEQIGIFLIPIKLKIQEEYLNEYIRQSSD